MKFSYFALLAVTAATLTACGGGGGDRLCTSVLNALSDTASTACGSSNAAPVLAQPAVPPSVAANAIDKYVGTWVACVPGVSGTSIKEVLAYTKVDATSANVTFTQTSHAGTTCAGNSTNTAFTSTSVANLAGTKTIGTSVADKVNIKAVSPAGADEKDISFIEGNSLKLGDDAMIDTDGYPKAFDNLYVYIKQ